MQLEKLLKRPDALPSAPKVVRKLIENKPLQQQKPAREDPDIVRLQESLSERLGAKVEIEHTNKGSGKLTLRYNSLDELDGILAHIK